jgi:pyruvate/2-oxoglutarate dehydrogenase complex dihydrolipoamide acyltransferase (E2) component
MTRKQRLSFLGIALAIAVAAVVVLTAGGGGDDTAQPAAATATPEATAAPQEAEPAEQTPEATATPRPKPPLLTGESVRTLTFEEGRTVRFRVRSAEPEEIHVHGYDIAKDVGAGETVTMSFKATITGIFEVEFEHSGTPIAELKVEPR